MMIDRRKEIGYPVQCGELLPSIEEMYSIFPATAGLEDLFDIPPSVVMGNNHAIELISPRGHVYDIDFESCSLDRRLFDKHLVKKAEEAGARLVTGESLVAIDGGVAKTTMGEIEAKVIVGADGPNSMTARKAGLERPRLRYPAITCKVEGQFEETVKMFFGSVAPGGYAWVIPKKSGANVGLGYSNGICRERPSVTLARFVSTLGAKVRDQTLGFVPMSGPARSTVAGNVLLVGDAAGQVMASNGGGIPTAMIAGREAGETIRNHLSNGGRLMDYESRWRARIGIPLRTSLRTRRLADNFFPNNMMLGLSMALLGRRGLDRAIRCKRLFI